ncbi:MAG: YfhO family protein [Chloroflexota bacterium]
MQSVARPQAPRGLARLSADARAVAILVLLSLGFFAVHSLLGLSYYEDDLVNEYYPLLVYRQQALLAGELPLWTTRMFLGYPFFADGTAGILFPLNWLAFLVPPQQAIMLLLGLGSAVAGVFFYLFVRSLGQSPTAALLAGLVYVFSGYAVGHWIHLSLAHSTITLPLGLWAIERACRARGRAVLAWLALAGVAAGLLWLGIHPQSAFTSTLILGLYAAFRLLFSELPGSFARRLGLLVGGGLVVGLLGAGLAAAQMLPMAEAALRGDRGPGVSYAFASSYALPWQHLATALWPYAFVAPDRFDWGLTNRWESAFYVGQLPLTLALLAVAARRDRRVAFWGGLALLGLWLGLANNAPLNLHRLVYNLPGFSLFRVPARFVQLTDLGLAVLAGYGLDLLAQPAWRARLTRHARRLAVLAAGLATLAALALLAIQLLPDLMSRVVWRLYATWPHHAGWRPEDVWPAVRQTWNLANPWWWLGTALTVLVAALVVAWRRRPDWPGWRALLVGLAAADLLLFSVHFWQPGPRVQLEGRQGPVIEYLREHGQGERVFSFPGSSTANNRLLNAGLDEVNSYAPLPPHRFNQLLEAAKRADNRLLDLFGVRWVVRPLAQQLPRQARGVGFVPRQPLLAVGARVPAAPPVLRAATPASTQVVRVVGRLAYAVQVPQGQTVAELVLRGPGGEERVLPIEAGSHLAEHAARRPDVAAALRHALPEVVEVESQIDDAGRAFTGLIFVADVAVPGEAFPTQELTLRATDPAVQTTLYGLALVGPDGTLTPSDRLVDSRYVERARDASSQLLESREVAPRLWLASEVRASASGAALGTLLRQGGDGRGAVWVEAPAGELPEGGSGPAGEAREVARRPDRLVVAVEPTRPTVLYVAEPNGPNWKATVDGQPAPIYYANHVFRAIVVQPGQREVVLSYEPESVRLGFAITGGTLLLLGALGMALWLAPRARGRRG